MSLLLAAPRHHELWCFARINRDPFLALGAIISRRYLCKSASLNDLSGYKSDKRQFAKGGAKYSKSHNGQGFTPEQYASDHSMPLDSRFPAREYPRARRLHRTVHLHIGPTNSGKSYQAIQSFKAAGSGFYAGPLRMLAREIYDRMEGEGIPCNLVTGDEVLEKDEARHNSGTVEMMDLGREMEVAVIDEIQMIDDPDRGWAWTRAFLGVRAQSVHLCGDPNSEKIIEKLVEQTGDKLEIHRYERLTPLRLETASEFAPLKKPKAGQQKSKSLYSQVQPGDCVVCFSKKEVARVRDKIVQAHGNRLCCSVVYGSLPPETRAEQARLFNSPDTGVDYLVASDAIGMGLNLGIKRIIFTTLRKFDGSEMRNLSTPQIKQIAGRAGRFRTADGTEGSDGVVTCLKPDDIPILRDALASKSPEIALAVLMPRDQALRSALIGSRYFQRNAKFSYILSALMDRTLTSGDFMVPRRGSAAEVAALFDNVRNLTFEDRLVLANAPVPTNADVVASAFHKMCEVIAGGHSATLLDLFPHLMSWLGTEGAVAETLEKIHKTITLFMWLSYRFPCNFIDRTSAVDLKRLCEAQFNRILSSQKNLSAPGRATTVQRKAISTRSTVERALSPFRRRDAKKRRQSNHAKNERERKRKSSSHLSASA